jgi:hypothetical protein
MPGKVSGTLKLQGSKPEDGGDGKLSVFFFGTWKSNKMDHGFIYSENRQDGIGGLRIDEVMNGHIFDHHGNEVDDPSSPCGKVIIADDYYALRSSLTRIHMDAIKNFTIKKCNKPLASTTELDSELESFRTNWIESQKEQQEACTNFYEEGGEDMVMETREKIDVCELLGLFGKNYRTWNNNNNNNKLILDFIRADHYWWFKVDLVLLCCLLCCVFVFNTSCFFSSFFFASFFFFYPIHFVSDISSS